MGLTKVSTIPSKSKIPRIPKSLGLIKASTVPSITPNISFLKLSFNRWGSPYLTREFFQNMGSKVGIRYYLLLKKEELVAGALNLIGGDTLYGQLWGCQPQAYYPSLHFEACYYQVRFVMKLLHESGPFKEGIQQTQENEAFT